jgi:hypothetical protein
MFLPIWFVLFTHALFTRPPYTRRGNHVRKTLLFSFGGVVSFISKAITILHPFFLLALLFPFKETFLPFLNVPTNQAQRCPSAHPSRRRCSALGIINFLPL